MQNKVSLFLVPKSSWLQVFIPLIGKRLSLWTYLPKALSLEVISRNNYSLQRKKLGNLVISLKGDSFFNAATFAWYCHWDRKSIIPGHRQSPKAWRLQILPPNLGYGGNCFSSQAYSHWRLLQNKPGSKSKIKFYEFMLMHRHFLRDVPWFSDIGSRGPLQSTLP